MRPSASCRCWSRWSTDMKPDGVVVAFDAGSPRFASQALAQYKIHRPPTADELRSQFPMVKELLEAMQVPIVEVEGWEGDDILGTLAVRGRDAGLRVLLVTGDRDAFQLVSDGVSVVTTKKGITDIVIYGPAEVVERYGVTPAQVPDFLGLKGDTSDNIPGVPGVGEKTAAKLLQQYGTLDCSHRARRGDPRASWARTCARTWARRSRHASSRRSRATCPSSWIWRASSLAASTARGGEGLCRAALHVAARPRAGAEGRGRRARVRRNSHSRRGRIAASGAEAAALPGALAARANPSSSQVPTRSRSCASGRPPRRAGGSAWSWTTARAIRSSARSARWRLRDGERRAGRAGHRRRARPMSCHCCGLAAGSPRRDAKALLQVACPPDEAVSCDDAGARRAV